jgi:hypothetical protein
MTSTRNLNTIGNYCLEEKSYLKSQNYTTYKFSQYGQAFDNKLPGLGLLPGQIPGNVLSNNTADIESFLFGIGSTNLIKPKECLVPELKNLQTLNIYKNPDVYLPEPLIVSKQNRPYPCP